MYGASFITKCAWFQKEWLENNSDVTVRFNSLHNFFQAEAIRALLQGWTRPPPFSCWWKKKIRGRGAYTRCLFRHQANQIANIFLWENKQIYIRKRKRKHPHMFFLMIHHHFLMVFLHFSSSFLPSSSFFLSDFISWPFLGLGSCFQITLLPIGQALLYYLPLFIPHSRLSSVLLGTKVSSVLSSQALISSSYLLPASKDQTPHFIPLLLPPTPLKK